jgi:DNA-binding transcriptional MerR regulator
MLSPNGGPGGEDRDNIPEDVIRTRLRKSADAFRTISEVADDLHVPQHVLRFWETKFPRIKPLKRGGGRRYYRPDDVALLRRIADLLYTQGYTIKGVQRLLRESGGALQDDIPPASPEEQAEAAAERAARPASLPAPIGMQETMAGSERPASERPASERPALSQPDAGQSAQKRDHANDHEVRRLRAALAEILAALEALRRELG